ncbi:MAG TPA: BMP family ABC transporter substrate-binding protein [Gaiellaceae bacterium]|nr:BMP family ABC transporter substrate-binding protein [Gaiellaceae bacterium]
MRRGLKLGWLTASLLVAVAALVATSVGAAPRAKVSTVGFASPEKPNDYGWNQQGYLGAQAAAKATGAKIQAATGIGYENVEPSLRRLAQRGADLIIAHASGYNTVAPKVAQQFKVPVVVWDAKGSTPGLVSNVITAAQEGAYLAGVLAAQVTQTKTLGIVVSASDENWFKQAGGFVQGARSVDKSIKFRYGRIGQAQYADAAGGKRITQQVIAAGADIVFGMGDGASFGMMQAVETAKAPSGASKVYFIDVIGNKTKIDKKGVLLSSELWDFTPIYTQAIKDANAGTFGKTYVLGAKNGLSLLKTNKAPASAWAKVKTAQTKVGNGSIKVVSTATEAAVKKYCKC